MDRYAIAKHITIDAGKLAMEYYRRLDTLPVEAKGHQDFVTEADREVELFIRRALEDALPDDGIVGEEHAPKPSASGFTWVIDPIDGTANFIKSIPLWTVVLAGVSDDRVQIGVIHEPVQGETFAALRGHGAELSGKPMRCPNRTLHEGAVGIGYSSRMGPAPITASITRILEEGGVFLRLASGAISLAYLAAGRLVGYLEGHMNAWDCLAGQLIVEEAGGRVEVQSADAMIADGGRVVAGTPATFDTIVQIANEAAIAP